MREFDVVLIELHDKIGSDRSNIHKF